VGTFAVQIAKSMGAEVTGVCSTRNVEMVRALGADHVIDYTKENFTAGPTKYAVILDNVGNYPLLAYRRVMDSDGVLVLIGGSKEGNWIGPLMRPLKAVLLSPFLSQTFTPFLARLNQKDLTAMSDLIRDGKVTPVIDRRYPLRAAPAAVAYVEEGRARGKVIISME
jgi:NADPH:quinone reductase-like Zn-dependent oxidoreductase